MLRWSDQYLPSLVIHRFLSGTSSVHWRRRPYDDCQGRELWPCHGHLSLWEWVSTWGGKRWECLWMILQLVLLLTAMWMGWYVGPMPQNMGWRQECSPKTSARWVSECVLHQRSWWHVFFLAKTGHACQRAHPGRDLLCQLLQQDRCSCTLRRL